MSKSPFLYPLLLGRIFSRKGEFFVEVGNVEEQSKYRCGRLAGPPIYRQDHCYGVTQIDRYLLAIGLPEPIQ